MAINKNFVIKNGIEVNDNVFVVDPNNNKVGIRTAIPEYELHVIGGIGVTDARVTGVTTALGDVLVANSNGVDGKAFAVRVSAGNSVGINTANPRYPLEIIGPASSGQVAEYVFGDLEITGDITSANINSGSANFTGITTFTDTTQNTLGNADTGAVQIDGGLGVNKNVTVGGQLRVTGDSFFVGVVTFAAGASGTIQLGDNANDNVEFQADVNSNIIPNTTSTFNLGSDSQEWRDLHLAGNAGIGSLSVTGISTFGDNVEITSLTDNRIPIVGAGSTIEDDANLTFDGSTLAVGVDLDVTGNTGIGSLVISGISTFSDNVEITSLTENRIPIVGAGSTIEDDANLTFDGSRLSVGVALTVSGISTFSGNIDADGDLDVDGHTELDDLQVSGITTFNNNVKFDSAGAHIEFTPSSYSGTAPNIEFWVGNDGGAHYAEIDSGNAGQLSIYNTSHPNGEIDIRAKSTVSTQLNGYYTILAQASGGVKLYYPASQGNILSQKFETIGTGVTVTGDTFTNQLSVSGVSTFVGVSSFTNTTENTLGDANTGAIKVDGGMGIAGNVTVGGGLSVTGNSYFVGMVTFAAGTDGNITLGDTNTDNVVFVADVDSNIVPNTDNAYDLGSSSQQWKDLYVNGLAELDFVNVSAASTFAGDVSIADKIVHTGDTNTAIRFPAADTFTVETAGSERLRIDSVGRVGIGTDNPSYEFHVKGSGTVAYFEGTGGNSFIGLKDSDDSTIAFIGVDGGSLKFQTSGSTYSDKLVITPAGSVGIGTTNPQTQLHVAGDSFFVGDVGIGGTISNSPIVNIDAIGDILLNYNTNQQQGIALLASTSGYGGKSTVQVYGAGSSSEEAFEVYNGAAGAHVAKITHDGSATFANVNVGGGLSVTGNSYFVGMVTFAAGTNGNITLGDNAGDNVVFNADVNSNFIPNTDNAYDLGSSSQQWRNLYVNGLSDLDFVNVSAASTFAGTIDANGNLDVDGYTELDDLNVAGVSTFAGLIDANGRIVGAATSNVIPFLYSNFSDLPSAATYHGAFAHVHATGKAYYAHANAWYELVNKNLAGIVGTGTEGYNVGVVTATNIDLNGDIDVDGHTELDNLNVSGISTFAQTNITNIDVTGITTTQILYVGAGGSTLTVDANNATFAIGSAATTVTATMNGGAIPSIGLVIALGG